MSCVGSTNSNHSGHAGNAGHILIGTPQSPLAPSSQSGLDVSLLRDFQGPNYDKGLVARDYSNTIGSRTGSRLDISASEHHRDSSENQPKKLGVGAVTGLISSGCSTDTEETGTNEMDLASSLEGQERRGLVEDFVDRSFGKESLGKGVIDALRKYIVEQDSVISNKEVGRSIIELRNLSNVIAVIVVMSLHLIGLCIGYSRCCGECFLF